MSNITEMTKEPNYKRGYADGKNDVTEKIKEHLCEAMAILTMENPPQEVLDAYKELIEIDKLLGR